MLPGLQQMCNIVKDHVCFNGFRLRDGVDAALSPTASQCAKLVMLKSQEEREGIHEGS
jgi:hypothetical protein